MITTRSNYFSFQSYLKKRNDDGSQHDNGGVEDSPEEEGDGQATHLCKLLYVCEVRGQGFGGEGPDT